MSSRRRAAKPTVALWMLIAIGDIALVLTGLGVVALVTLASLVAVTAGGTCAWVLQRRGVPVHLARRSTGSRMA